MDPAAPNPPISRPRVKDHLVEVTAVDDLQPWYRRLTFDALGLFESYDPAPGAYLMLNLTDPATRRPVQRAYSIHQVTPASFCVDVVLHTPAGPGSAWGAAARPGSTITVTEPPYALVVPPVSQALLIADPSATGAVSSLLESMDPAITTRVVVVDHHSEPDRPAFALPGASTTSYHWLPELSEDHLRRLTVDLDPADCFVWAAGERGLAKLVKDHLRHTFPARQVAQHVQTYWIKKS